MKVPNGVIKTNYILNKINIYIVDLIGIKSGMHYYHSSLQNLFKANGYALRILSNYNCGNNQFFPFIFSGNFFIKIIKVFNAVIKYFYICAFLFEKRWLSLFFFWHPNRCYNDYYFIYAQKLLLWMSTKL